MLPPPTRRALLGALLSAALLSAGCQTGRMHQATVVVEEPPALETRLERARRAAASAWADGALKEQIVQRFPGVRPEDLSGMFLHWARVKLGDGGPEGVVIQVGVREVADRVPADQVAAFVAERCREELARVPLEPR